MNTRYIVKKKIKVKKHLVFLCGANYVDKPFDKRKILKDFIDKTSEGTINPIIVDDILNKENLETENFTIEEYEELVSGISALNFVFLESFSSASELGLFTHSKSKSLNYVFYPDSSNLILDKAGYFIKYGVLSNFKKVVAEPYSALVERYAHGTDYIDEHYYFAKNLLPENLSAVTKSAINKINFLEFELKCTKFDDTPNSLDFFEISYDLKSEKIYLSTRTAFYLLYSLLFKVKKHEEITVLNIIEELDYFSELFNEIVTNTLRFYCDLENVSNYKVNVLDFEDISKFISNALFLIKYMFRKSISDKTVYKMSLAKANEVLLNVDYKTLENEIFPIPQGLSHIKKLKCIKRFTLYKKYKSRNIIAYHNVFGTELRLVHEKIVHNLSKLFTEHSLFSKQSFAYKKGISTLDCVSKHKQSKYFLKIDISNFFENISFKKLVECVLRVVKKDNKYLFMSSSEKVIFQRRLERCLSYTKIGNKFPIGFISSPIISEIYLSDFDNEISEKCEEMGIIYTRYADDIMFSSQDEFDFHKIKRIVVELLNLLELSINDSKTRISKFSKNGDSINYVGLFLVFDGVETSISIGNSYIKELALLKVYGAIDSYHLKKVQGLESYLRFNDKKGYEKYLRIVDIYSFVKDKR